MTLQGTIITPTPDMDGWSAEMRPASFVIRAPAGPDGQDQTCLIYSGSAWRFPADQLPAVRALLREASRWFRTVWRFDPATGHVFGPDSDLASRRDGDYIVLRSERFAAPGNDALELSYAELPIVRRRLKGQHSAMRLEQRKASDGIRPHR